ncbi:MAG TPA: DsrE family protein [Gallionellaceae bacterium]|nr:DsrE family protein [Gallionellaceae bacterium]
MSIRKNAGITFAAFALALFAIQSVQAAEPAAAEKKSEYVVPKIKHDRYGKINLVVPLTTNDKGIQGMKMRNITNGLDAAAAWHGKVNVVVVLYAKGLSLLENPDEKFAKLIDTLRGRGVHFVVCNNSMREQGVDFHKLYHVTDADIVPSGFLEVAFLQAHKHFVVDPSL